MSREQAQEIAAALLGSAVEKAREVPASAEHQVFRVAHGGLVSFLKVADGDLLSPELAVIELLGRRGIPVPEIEARELAGGQAGVSCALIGHVGGAPVDHEATEFAAAGAILRQVHEITLDGYGTLADGDAGLHGRERTWDEAIRLPTQGLESIAEAGLVDPVLLASAAAAVDESRGRLRSPAPGRLLHGDFHPRHVYADASGITGIIDWGDASCGDPLYDFARILHSVLLDDSLNSGLAAVNRVRQSYGDAAWLGEPDAVTETLLVYAVVFILAAMKSELAGGAPWPPWWPAQAAALTTILGAL